MGDVKLNNPLKLPVQVDPDADEAIRRDWAEANLAGGGGGGAPSGPAGGVLSGTYPNPGFAADMATQAELDAHVGAGGSAHANVVAGGAAGFQTGADKTKLDGFGTPGPVDAAAVPVVGPVTTSIENPPAGNTPASVTYFASPVGAEQLIFRATVTGISLPPSGTILKLQYTTDLTGASGWTDVASTSLSISSTGSKSSGWVSVPVGMKTDILLRAATSGGDGSGTANFAPLAVFVRNPNNSSGAGGAPITDHGTLTGLADDDHTQYHTDARGDARYAAIAHVGAGGTAHANAVAAGAAGFMTGTDKTKLDGIEANAKDNPSSSEIIGAFTGTPDGTKYLKDNGTLGTPSGGSGAAIGAFSAQKTTDQLNIPNATWTKVNFETEDFDVSGYYVPGSGSTDSRYTPLTAGYYRLSTFINLSPAVDGGRVQVAIYKNGVEFARVNQAHAGSTSNVGTGGTCVVNANGSTDYFETYMLHNFGVATSDLVSSATFKFQGEFIGT